MSVFSFAVPVATARLCSSSLFDSALFFVNFEFLFWFCVVAEDMLWRKKVLEYDTVWSVVLQNISLTIFLKIILVFCVL